MKKRMPVDIQFLLESILAENPDTVKISDEQKAELISKGADINFDSVDWGDSGALPFYIDLDTKVLIFANGNTHGSMERALKDAAIFATYDSKFVKKYPEISTAGMIGFRTKVYGTKISVYFFGLQENNHKGMQKYLRENRRKILDLEIRGSGKGGHATELCGRLWKGHNVVSFWNDKERMNPHLPIIFKFIKQIKKDPTKYVYQFIDSKSFYTYKTLNKQVSDSEKLTPEEIMDLLKKQHLDQKAKKELWGMLSPEQKSAMMKKYAKGFDFAAQADASMPALEGHIKLKDLLKEDPDTVRSDDGEKDKIAWWSDDDAVAFFAFDKFSIYKEGGTHSQIIDFLYEVFKRERLSLDSSKFISDAQKRLNITDIDGMFNSFTEGPLSDYFSNAFDNDVSIYNDNDVDSGAFRVKPGGLAGRAWKNQKILSFWNTRQEILKRWKNLEKLFNSTGKLGKLPEYKIDWLERELNDDIPMTPASEVSSSSGSKDNQLNFLDKLAGDSPISPEELKKLQIGLHKMKPAEKKEALKKLGVKNMKYERLAAIADKLGMTVAEFNHIMNVNEEIS